MGSVLDYMESAAYAVENSNIVGTTPISSSNCYGCRSCRGPNCNVSEPIEDSSGLVEAIQEVFS